MESTDKESFRRQINLKNLQRHDASIDEILRTTSYVATYSHSGEGWVKSNVEGPMFLFSNNGERSTRPRHGFFVLNRNGLEYLLEVLAPDSELRLEGEFILFEPGGGVERATGIWVSEEKERRELFQEMEALRKSS